MTRTLPYVIGAFLLIVLVPGARAQGVVNYPPADGMMYAPAPVFPAPGGFGGDYAQTYPSVPAGGVLHDEPQRRFLPQPGVTATYRVAPRVRDGSPPAVPVPTAEATASPLPRTQPPCPRDRSTGRDRPWPPNYTPFSRYQGYGGAYGYGPYGSGYYTGYYKGFSMGY